MAVDRSEAKGILHKSNCFVYSFREGRMTDGVKTAPVTIAQEWMRKGNDENLQYENAQNRRARAQSTFSWTAIIKHIASSPILLFVFFLGEVANGNTVAFGPAVDLGHIGFTDLTEGSRRGDRKATLSVEKPAHLADGL